MPWPVNCPECGADGTALANEAIEQSLAGPVSTAAPMFIPPPAPAAPPALVSGLRINRTAHEDVPPPSAAAYAPPPIVVVQPQRQRGGGMAGWQKGLIGILVALVLIGGIYKVTKRIIKTMGAVSMFASVVGDIEDMLQFNLHADDQVILYVKSGDNKAVAQECADYWKEHFKRELKIIKPGESSGTGAEFVVMPAHHSYVRLMGQLEWKEPDFEDCAKHLSEKLKTMVFVQKDVDFTGEFVFGVYDQGSNLFHARMDVKMVAGEPEEKVTLEHKEWAYTHGYKVKKGEDGKMEDFNIADANEITKKFGMKFWDENDEKDLSAGTVILKDPAMPSRGEGK
jgi:hypothetical protein